MAGRVSEARLHAPSRPTEVTVEAVVAARAAYSGWTRLDLERVLVVAADPSHGPDAPEAPRRIRVWLDAESGGDCLPERLLPGDRVRMVLRIRPPHAPRNPGARGAERRLRRLGIGAYGRLAHPSLQCRIAQATGPSARRKLETLRLRLGADLSRAPEGSPLLRALLLGDRSQLRPELRTALARLGLSHLLAISGLHLIFVAGLAFALTRSLARGLAPAFAGRDPRKVCLLLALAAAGAYGLLAGWSVSVQRAFVFLLALVMRAVSTRPGSRTQPLALAALLVLVADPAALFDPGAQMSFAASAALARILSGVPSAAPSDRIRRIWRAWGDLLGASAVAILVTAPLAAVHFGQVSPAALLANAWALPFVALVLLPAAVATLAVLLVAPDAVLTEFLLALAGTLAGGTETALIEAARVLPALGATSTPQPVALGLLAVGAGALVVFGQRRSQLFGAALLPFLLAALPPAAIAPGPPRVVFLDVGQGDATLIQGRLGTVLIDAGLALPDGLDRGRERVVPAIRALGIERLDLVVASHADADHRGGLVAVLEAFPVGVLWLPVGQQADPGFEGLIRVARRRGVPVRARGAANAPERFGDLRVVPLWPDRAHPLEGNDGSLVLRIETAWRRVLVPGDIEAAAEAELLARGVDLKADVLKLAHHGSRTSSSRAFLDAVDPRHSVASAPCQGRYAMPHPALRRRLRDAGRQLLWTGRDGAVIVSLDGSSEARTWGASRENCLSGP